MSVINSRYKLVIYDCDGVLLDTLDSNYIFYNSVMEYLGRPPLDRNDLAARAVLHTYSFNNVMEHFFAGDDRKEAAWEYAKTIRYKDLAPFMRVEDGLVETLEKLRGSFSLAVCTNRATSMEMIIEDFGLTGFFSCVMTAAKVINPKPHPEPLLKVLEHYRLQPHEALFVGDSEVDRLAAQGAGVPFVAYKSDLEDATRIDHHTEIFKHLI